MLLHTENVSKYAFSKEIIDNSLEISEVPRFGILGVPFDGTTSYIPGARFGPKSVREASYNFEGYNLNLGRNIPSEIVDVGDLEVVHGNYKKTCSKLRSTIDDMINMNLMPITIGGDHSISYPILKAMDDNGGLDNLTVIHFDAHMDMREEYAGEKYSHATVMRRIFDLNPKKIIQIGIRSAAEEEAKFEDKKLVRFNSNQVFEEQEKILKVLEAVNGQIYISFDIDVLDPAYAPSVGTPSTCGLNPRQIEKFIISLQGRDVVGMDVVEVASTQIGDSTALNAAKIIHDFLCIQ